MTLSLFTGIEHLNTIKEFFGVAMEFLSLTVQQVGFCKIYVNCIVRVHAGCVLSALLWVHALVLVDQIVCLCSISSVHFVSGQQDK